MQFMVVSLQITNTDTARVLTMIETSCPNALSRKASTDEVLINFDALTPRCFHEVNTFVLSCFLNISGSKKNKKRKAGEGNSADPANAAAAASLANSDVGPSSSVAAEESGGAAAKQARSDSKNEDAEGEAEF